VKQEARTIQDHLSSAPCLVGIVTFNR